MLFNAKLMYSHKYLRDYFAKIINKWKTTICQWICMAGTSMATEQRTLSSLNMEMVCTHLHLHTHTNIIYSLVLYFK